MSKLTQYTALTTTQSDDIVPIVDVHDTSMAATGTTKKITVANLLAAAPGAVTSVNSRTGAVVIGASDIPQLAQYNPTGLTGATTPTSYAGGTVSGHPLSGTWTQGQWVVDQQGHIFVCVAGGTPGTWRRVGKDPWQFFLDDYAKGDGKQALVTTVAGSAIINTTPLAAPAAPTLSNAGTGGTILAGVYQVIVTYVNRWGETVGSASASTTTSGTTSTITITAPAMSGNATGWYAYVTQAGGSVYTRQQASGSPSNPGVPLVLTAPPTNTGANPPGADSSAAQVFTSTAVDGGKNIMICGGLGTPGAPWIDTIATVQSPTQATLSSNGASQGGNVSQAGCAMVFASDDRLAIDQCISDSKAYALANNNFAQVIGGDKNYGLGTGFFQTLWGTDPSGMGYNTQVRIPPGNPSSQTEKLEWQLLGPGDNAHCVFWPSQYVNLNGCTFLSFSIGPATADPTYGQQSVIGGPQNSPNAHGANGFVNTKAVIRGIQVVQPGWSNTVGIDLQWIAGFVLRGSSMVFAPSTATGGGVNPSGGWMSNSFWQQKIAIGLRAPNEGNNDDCVIESFATEGMPRSITTGADHLTANRLVTINGYFGIQVTGGDANTHDLTIDQWSFENMSGGVLQNNSGGHIKVNITMDGENTGPAYDIQDNGNHLFGVVRWSDPFRTPVNGIIAPIVQGASNLEIINGHVTRGAQTAPAVPASTVALTNPFWRHAWVVVSGGTVSAIAVDGVATGLTSGTFRVPSGKTITLTYTVAPTWNWWLD